jgi:hypothetical protein
VTTFVVTCVVLAVCGGGDAMKHEPDPYRQQIEAIESLLQKSESAEGDCGTLHTLSANLAEVVARDIQHHTHKEIVTNRLVGFGQDFASQEEQGMSCDLAGAREQWKLIRSELFQEADWYRAL